MEASKENSSGSEGGNGSCFEQIKGVETWDFKGFVFGNGVREIG